MERLVELYRSNGLLQPAALPSPPWLHSAATCELLGQQLLDHTPWGQACKAQGETAWSMMEKVRIAMNPAAEDQEVSMDQLQALITVRGAVKYLSRQQVARLNAVEARR